MKKIKQKHVPKLGINVGVYLKAAGRIEEAVTRDIGRIVEYLDNRTQRADDQNNQSLRDDTETGQSPEKASLRSLNLSVTA